MSQAVAKVAKPQLRSLLTGTLKTQIGIALSISVAGAVGYKLLISEPRKRRYKTYYENYDADKDFARMREAGVFTSVLPGGEPGTGW